MNTEKKYRKMLVKELKNLCRQKELKVSGTKAQLIHRLLNPTETDLPPKKTNKYITVSLGWGDEKAPLVGQLISKGFGESLYYSDDKFYYKVLDEKWGEVLKKVKK